MITEPTTTVATWNLEWATNTSPRGRTINNILEQLDADVICLTEAHASNFPSNYHVIEAEADYGYPLKPGRRKVLLGSKQPWTAADHVGQSDLPGGRYISGTTSTELGALKFIGVCIPWRDAHVRTGSKDRAPWSDHRAYLENLQAILGRHEDTPTIILGDFNQTLPRGRQSEDVAEILEKLLIGLNVPTRSFSHDGRRAIDHIATSMKLEVSEVTAIPSQTDGRKLSDHFGVWCSVQNRNSS